MCDSQYIEQAIKDYQSGKDAEENFAKIYGYYRPKLISFFAKRGFPQYLLEDLTQDVFKRVYKRMAEFRGGDSVKAFSRWLFRIAENISRDDLRRRITKKRDGQTISLDGEGDYGENPALLPNPPGPSRTFEPLKALLNQELKEALEEAVERLPGQMRRCMRLHLDQGRSNREIAVIMGISVETVKAHLRQGIAKLKMDEAFAKLKAGQIFD